MEFAFVSIVMVMLFGVGIAIGTMLLQGMITSSAGASAGNILHHHPRLSPEAFAMMRGIEGDEEAFKVENPSASEVMRLITAEEPEFSDRFGPPLYDERMLVLTEEDYREATRSNAASLPVINRLLLPNYIFDADLGLYRYPGALVTRADDSLTVLVPIIDSTQFQGFDTGECSECDNVTNWLPPVRISKLSNVCSCSSSEMPAGLVADGEFSVTVTFPAQAGSVIEYRPVLDGSGNQVVNQFGPVRERVIADDSTLAQQLDSLPPGYTLAPATPDPELASLSTRGDYGLGELEVLDMSSPPFTPIRVRPYRRVFEHASTFKLGQRFEAMYRISSDDVVNLSPLGSGTALPNNFLMTLPVHDDAQLFRDSGSAEATLPINGKWRVAASVQLELADSTALPVNTWSLELLLYRNGILDPNIPVIAVNSYPAGFVGPYQITGSTIVNASAPSNEVDMIEVRVRQSSGVALNFLGPEAANWISVEAVFVNNATKAYNVFDGG